MPNPHKEAMMRHMGVSENTDLITELSQEDYPTITLDKGQGGFVERKLIKHFRIKVYFFPIWVTKLIYKCYLI